MADLLNKDPSIYKEEKERFLKELKVFHVQRGTPYRHLPGIEGKELDLYKLYWLVTAHGGWEKVNARSGWEDLVALFGIPETTANGSLFLKQVYLRYLDAYEKIHFLGEEDEEGESWFNGDEEDSRSRRQKAQKITSTVPLTYNHQQHQIPEESRATLNLATNTYRKSDYDRLVLSLASPLPNEQDFGINVCTLLSNEGRHTLKLAKCPRLLDLLLAHAGVFNHDNLASYMNTLYKEARNYDLMSFWKDACQDECVRKLMLRYEKAKIVRVTDDSDNELFFQARDLGTRELTGQRILQVATIIRNLSFEEENSVLLAKSSACFRFCLLCCTSNWTNLHQMGFDILSNVASEVFVSPYGDEDCLTNVLFSTLMTSMGSSDRFQVISALDILNKLCTNELNENFMGHVLSDQRSLFQQLITYLSLHDIHLLISTLECLFSLSSLGENSCNAIVRTHGAVEALVSLITVEAQSYGPEACVLMRVVETVPGVGQHTSQQQQQHQLTSLTTLSTANAGIQRISEAPNIVRAIPPQQQQQVKIPVQLPVVSLNSTGTPNSVPAVPVTQMGKPPPLQTTVPSTAGANLPQTSLQKLPVASSSETSVLQPANAVLKNESGGATPMATKVSLPANPSEGSTEAGPKPSVQPQRVQIKPPVPSSQATTGGGSQQVQLRVSNDEANRTFCLSWLKATYESVSGSSIQHEIMYKQYLASLHKLGKRDVISAQHYAACVRSIFGGSVGPNKRILTNGSTASFFEGVKVRSQPLPLKLPQSTPISANQTPGAAATHPNQQQMPASPILTNLLHQKPTVATEKTVIDADSAKKNLENESVLDGILPKASSLLDTSKSTNGHTGNVNGIARNGCEERGLKRPALSDSNQSPLPIKAPHVNGLPSLANGAEDFVIAKQETNGNGTTLSTNGIKKVSPSPMAPSIQTNGLSPTAGQTKPETAPTKPLSSVKPVSVPPRPPPSATQAASPIKPNPQTPFICEWSGCMKAFKTPKEVENHAIKIHCPLDQTDIPCLWLRCDGMKRKRFSLMTHIQDRHCHPQLMKLMAVRRVQMATAGKSDVPLPPAPPPHPGYAPNAALHAIKRHAAEFVNPKALAMGDEKEGPVTKSIRLTSSLILKNLVMFSSLGRGRLKSFESHLSTVALSNVESSRTVSQILFEMSTTSQS